MRVNIIADSDGDYGMGHIVRQHRLAQVLRQRGASIGFYLDEEPNRGRELVAGFSLPTVDEEETRYCDTLIVDKMENDDDELEYLRKFCQQLVVFVGVGSTITPDTYWIADCVIWQTMHWVDAPNIFVDKAHHGKDWLILSPSLRDAELPNERDGIATYFGGGVNGLALGLGPNVVSGKYALGGLAQTQWKADVGEELLGRRAFLGTMGMVAYEAMAAGLRPLVVSRSEDHLRTARKLQNNMLAWNIGLADEWDGTSVADVLEILGRSEKQLRVRSWQRPDGWGAWRIADLILNGV